MFESKYISGEMFVWIMFCQLKVSRQKYLTGYEISNF